MYRLKLKFCNIHIPTKVPSFCFLLLFSVCLDQLLPVPCFPPPLHPFPQEKEWTCRTAGYFVLHNKQIFQEQIIPFVCPGVERTSRAYKKKLCLINELNSCPLHEKKSKPKHKEKEWRDSSNVFIKAYLSHLLNFYGIKTKGSLVLCIFS